MNLTQIHSILIQILQKRTGFVWRLLNVSNFITPSFNKISNWDKPLRMERITLRMFFWAPS